MIENLLKFKQRLAIKFLIISILYFIKIFHEIIEIIEIGKERSDFHNKIDRYLDLTESFILISFSLFFIIS